MEDNIDAYINFLDTLFSSVLFKWSENKNGKKLR